MVVQREERDRLIGSWKRGGSGREETEVGAFGGW